MRFLVSIISLISFGRLAADDSVVRFANGDQLSGRMQSLDQKKLMWDSAVFSKATPFFLDHVLDVSLFDETPDWKADHEATITLTRGDVVRGMLVSVSDKVVALDTSFAGRMQFNRLMVQSIRIEEPSAMVYRGPSSMDGWIRTDGAKAWSYKNLAIVSKGSGSIARDDLLPEECTVTFDAEWKADSFGFKVVLFSDQADSDSPSSGYEIAIQRGNIYVRNCSTRGYMGNSHSSVLAESDRVSVKINASRKTGRISLSLNDRLVDVWDDMDLAGSKFGDALHFISQNAMPLRISRIGVAQWSGHFPEVPEPRPGVMRQWGLGGVQKAPAKKPVEEGRMELANGDTIKGEVISIDQGMIKLKTPLGEVKLPAARLRTVALPKVELEEAIRRNGDIHAWFPDGGRITFRLDSLADGKITGSSQSFGNATFNLSAFSRLDFNIYDQDLESKRTAEAW